MQALKSHCRQHRGLQNASQSSTEIYSSTFSLSCLLQHPLPPCMDTKSHSRQLSLQNLTSQLRWCPSQRREQPLGKLRLAMKASVSGIASPRPLSPHEATPHWHAKRNYSDKRNTKQKCSTSVPPLWSPHSVVFSPLDKGDQLYHEYKANLPIPMDTATQQCIAAPLAPSIHPSTHPICVFCAPVISHETMRGARDAQIWKTILGLLMGESKR